jgi:FkbM family methyltransferase
VLEIRGKRFEVRDGTLDAFIVRENAGKMYARLQLQPSDTVLDVGANIGAFAVLHAGQVNRVIAVEPEPENLALLRCNTELNGCDNVTIVPRFVTGAPVDFPIKLYLNVRQNRGAHSAYVKRGRVAVDVLTVTLDQLIETYHPTVAKIDVEGAEYEMLLHTDYLGELRELVFEWHSSVLRDGAHERYRYLIRDLQTYFEHVEYVEDIGKRWTAVVYCRQGV